MRIRTTRTLVSLATVAAPALSGVARARHGADDPTGHARGGADDGANHT